MSAPSVHELERLFDDEALAAEARFLAVATAWPSLRVLDHLHAAGPSTTGEVARTLNMDMAEVHDRLEDLAAAGLVAADGDVWVPAVHSVAVHLGGDEDGLEVDHFVGEVSDALSTDDRAEPSDARTKMAADGPGADDGEADMGPFARLGHRIDELLP